jgi:hypothetical protein
VLGPILTEAFGKRMAAKKEEAELSPPRPDLFRSEPMMAGAGQELGV